MKQLLVEVLAGALCVLAAWHYLSGQISRACFALLGMGILLVLTELKKNRGEKVVNCYTECSFFAQPLDISHSSDPPDHGASDGTQR